MPQLQISEQELKIVQAILAEYLPNTPVWAFGSRVKGNSGRYSDLDLAIHTEKPLDFVQLAKLEQAFSDSDLAWKVDLLDWAATSESFKKIVTENYVVIQ